MPKKSLKTQLMILAFVGAFFVTLAPRVFAADTPSLCGDLAVSGPNSVCYFNADHSAVTYSSFRPFTGTYSDVSNPLSGEVSGTGASFPLGSPVEPCTGAYCADYWFRVVVSGVSYVFQIVCDTTCHDVLPDVVNDYSTRFILPYTPATGAYSSSTPTTFSAGYYNSGIEGYDLVSFAIKDVTNPASHPLVFPVSASLGSHTVTNNVALTNSHAYLWRPVIYSSTGNPAPTYGDWYSFQSTSTPNATFDPNFVSGTVGTSTLLSSTNLLSFLNVPSLLQTKIPFAYIFQIADGFAVGLTASSSAIPSGLMSYKLPGTATSSQDMFSTSTISRFLSPTMIATLRGLQLAILYMLFGYALYRIAKSKHLL